MLGGFFFIDLIFRQQISRQSQDSPYLHFASLSQPPLTPPASLPSHTLSPYNHHHYSTSTPTNTPTPDPPHHHQHPPQSCLKIHIYPTHPPAIYPQGLCYTHTGGVLYGHRGCVICPQGLCCIPTGVVLCFHNQRVCTPTYQDPHIATSPSSNASWPHRPQNLADP